MAQEKPNQLALLNQASQLLADACSIDDVKQVRDVAEAARVFAKAARLGLELQNQAAEVRLRAERKAGQFLAGFHFRGGDRRSKGHDARLKLDDLGISPDQSKRWQRLASVSDEEFVRYIDLANSHDREITAAALLRLARLRKADRKSAGNPEAVIIQAATSQSHDLHHLVAELQQHRALLEDVLQPVCQGSDSLLKPAERRVVGHLLREMDATLRALSKQVKYLS